MRNKTLIVFDIDGTLTNSSKIHIQVFKESLRSLGLINYDSNFSNYKNITDSYILKRILDQNNQEYSENLLNKFEDSQITRISNFHVHEISGARKLINILKKHPEYKICFTTGSLRKPAIFKLNAIKVDFDEQQLVASNYFFEREKIVKQAIRNAEKGNNNFQFKCIILIGDATWDLKAAHQLKLNFIGIGNKYKDVLMKEGCLYHFKDLSETKILESIRTITNTVT